MPDARVSGHREAIESKLLCFRPFETKELCDAAKAEVVCIYVEVKQTTHPDIIMSRDVPAGVIAAFSLYGGPRSVAAECIQRT